MISMQPCFSNLPTRRFGRTEINIPVLSIGGMRFQHSWSEVEMQAVPKDNQKNLEKILKFSVASGLHHIETARHYGTSENQLGCALKTISDSQRILQTKVPPRDDPELFEQELEQSFSKLQCKKLNLLAIHGINLPEHLDQTIRPGGCLEVVRRWQHNGLIDFVGFSTHGPTDLIVQAIQTNLFDYVNLHWYFIFQENEPALEAAKNFDLGVFIISPTDKGGHLHTPSTKLMELCSPLHPIVFNDLFCLSDPRVHTISLGASNIEDFSLHFDALGLLSKANHMLPIIKERLVSSAKDSLGEYWLNTWKVGLPTWENTPGKINIRVLMWLYNLYKAWGMTSYVQARYSLLGSGGHWFPGENADCVDSEVSSHAIELSLKLSPWTDQIIDRLRELRDTFKGESLQRLSNT